MDKVVLDSLRPDESCYNPPPANPSQADTCKVEATYHNPEDPKSPTVNFSFQREKDHYILNPDDPGKIAVLQGLKFDEKNPLVQSSLHFSVFLNGMHKRFYPSFQSVFNYYGPDLLPYSQRMNDFLVAGNIETPDAKQNKETANLLRQILPYRNPEQDWFLRTLKYLLGEPITEQEKPAERAMPIPPPIRPRIQWMRDQFKFHEELRSKFSSVQDNDLKKKLENLSLSLLVYVNTGEGGWDQIKDELDTQAKATQARYPLPSELANLFKLFSDKMDSYSKNVFFEKNPEAFRRLSQTMAYLKKAVSDHRTELLSLSPEHAFEKSLKYQILEASQNGSLALKVKSESEDANLSNNWIKDHIEELSEAVIPALKFMQPPGKTPRVKVDVATLKANTDLLTRGHYVQAREYRIGVLSVLRFLFGNNLSDTKVSGWSQDGIKPIEVDWNPSQSFFDYRDQLTSEISKSVKKTSIVLPITEGVVLAGGIGLTIAGRADNSQERTPLNLIGPSVAGLGGGALLCHMILKTRNQYISDGLCGLVGAGIGLGVGFLTTQNSPGKPPTSGIDGRNPTNGYGP